MCSTKRDCRDKPGNDSGVGAMSEITINRVQRAPFLARTNASPVQAAALIVLPMLPDKPIGPYDALNLRTIWTIVILVMGVSALGYVAVRLVGSRFGLPLAGLAAPVALARGRRDGRRRHPRAAQSHADAGVQQSLRH